MGIKGWTFVLGIFAAGAWMSAVHGQNAGHLPVNLMWDASPQTNVVGYFLYIGPASATYTQRFKVGNVTAATIIGLTPGTTNYFVITAYDADVTESVPSNEVSYIVPGTLQSSFESDNTFHLLFPVAEGHSYDVQFSNTLTNWATLTTIFGQTNNIYDFVDTNFSGVGKRFYRLILN